MSHPQGPLEESDEAIPTSPSRRRVAMVVGLLLALLLLVALIWFGSENTETHEPGGMLGARPPGAGGAGPEILRHALAPVGLARSRIGH